MVAIPEHVDQRKGLFVQLSTLDQVLDNKYLYAAELFNNKFKKPQSYISWNGLMSSDTHDFSANDFGRFTWIKMAKPSIDGLKLALIDVAASVNRDIHPDPNRRVKTIGNNWK